MGGQAVYAGRIATGALRLAAQGGNLAPQRAKLFGGVAFGTCPELLLIAPLFSQLPLQVSAGLARRMTLRLGFASTPLGGLTLLLNLVQELAGLNRGRVEGGPGSFDNNTGQTQKRSDLEGVRATG
jgi:hypothetical protein